MDWRRCVVRMTFGMLFAASTFVVAQQPPGQPPTPAAQPQQASPPQPMSFFVTSVGVGDGANLGGLAGADAHCQRLASAVGAGNRTWRAYFSGVENGKPVNAKDR